jgi:HEPN domain-containing protein
MEKKLNSYYGMGYNDYLYAKHSINAAKEIGNYNGVAALASQSAEKLLKAVIER